jgi:hypothetical protein
MGFLLLLSVLMVNPFTNTSSHDPQLTSQKIGVAWLLGARFDVAVNELASGNFARPSDPSAAQSIISKYDHGEL